MQGLFLTFEGIDGAGKSTHISAAASAFAARGREVLRTREPGGTPLAEALRALLLHEEMDAHTQALLAFAARRDHLRCRIAPALERGAVVLCDRFTDSSFAYQGGGGALDWGVLQALERSALAQPDAAPLRPHCTLWFDLPAALAAQRTARARTPDRFEAQPLAYFERVAQAYARRMREDAARFVRIDAAQGVEAVGAAVMAALHERQLL